MRAAHDITARAALLAPLALLGLAHLSACTADAGNGFGTMESAGLEASFEPGGRLADDGSFVVLGGYRVHPDDMHLEVVALHLDELVTVSAGGGGVFDPSNPPPGYSLCHGGHCHHEDGRLVDYEDVQAELSAGGASEYVTRVSMPVSESLPILEAQTRALTRYEPSAELPQGTLSRTRVTLRRFTMTGTVTGGGFGDSSYPITVDVGVEGALSSLQASREVSLDAPPDVHVFATVALPADFLDNIDLAGELEDGQVTIDRGASAESVALSVLSTPLGVVLN